MTPARSLRLASWILLMAGAMPASRADADFALRDGDTVVFLGDSITAARTFGKIVENYTLLRFPDRKVRFLNAGRGGDTAARGLERLDRDVLDRGATVVIVAYGINDIAWGTKADAEHEQKYLDSIRGIIERCRARRARPFIASAAITAEDPDRAEGGPLQVMCDRGLALARDLGAGAIDVQRAMRAIQLKVRAEAARTGKEKDKPSLHAGDGVHLNDLGQLAMAYALLKGLDAPAEVSSVTVEAGPEPKLVEARGCRVSNLGGGPDRLEFDRLDDGLPINFGTFGALQFRFVPIPDGLNGYRLAVRGLPPGRHDVLADGRGLGAFTAEELDRGVNIASSTADGWEPGGPWDAEAGILIRLTDARSELAEADRLLQLDQPNHPARAAFRDQSNQANDRLVDLQRTLVRPRPFRFVVRPAAAKPAP